MMRPGFTTLLVYMLGALLSWLGCFVFVYVLAALACERGLDAFGGDMTLLRVLSVAAVLATATLTVWIVLRARRHVGSPFLKSPTEDTSSFRPFVRFVTVGGGALTLLALAWLVVPPLLLPFGCDAH